MQLQRSFSAGWDWRRRRLLRLGLLQMLSMPIASCTPVHKATSGAAESIGQNVCKEHWAFCFPECFEYSQASCSQIQKLGLAQHVSALPV